MASTSERKRGLTRQRRGQQENAGEAVEPRLPHERDESSDSQDQGVRDVIRQGARDIEQGRVDTDRGPVMERIYRRVKGRGR
jgi:hypothetical protein